MFNRLLAICFLFLSVYQSFSQDAFFSNANQSLIYLNPSFAGTNGFIRNQNVVRVQDINRYTPVLTSYNSLDAFIRPINGGLAISYIRDDQAKGRLITSAASMAYSQHIFAYSKKLKIIPAVQGTFYTKNLDVNGLRFRDTIEPRTNYRWDLSAGQGLIVPLAQKKYVDIAASILLQSKDMTFGLALFHLNQPDAGLVGPSKLPFKINIHGSYNLKLTEELNVSFFGLFVSQKDFKDYMLSCNLNWNNEFFIGAGIRKANALTANLAFQVESFRLGIGYDYGLNSDNAIVYGKSTIEVMLSFNFKNTKSENSPIADWKLW